MTSPARQWAQRRFMALGSLTLARSVINSLSINSLFTKHECSELFKAAVIIENVLQSFKARKTYRDYQKEVIRENNSI